MVARTQSLWLSWRPELGFYEQRSTILRRLESEGLLDAFQVLEGLVRVRICKNAALRLSVDGARFAIAGPGVNWESMAGAVEACLGVMQPREVRVAMARFQLLNPVSADSQMLQQATARAVSPALVIPGGAPTDWALLVDGYSEGVGWRYQVEYGVVGGEVADRLARGLGRAGIGPMPDPLIDPDTSDLPDCAFFLDWSWHSGSPLESEAALATIRVWDLLLKESEALSDQVVRHHSPAADRREFG